MNNLVVKIADNNIKKELESVNFDCSYIDSAVLKYKGNTYKIFNLKTPAANILKQLCLSLGFDCAVSRDTITCGCDKTDVIMYASDSQILKLVNKLQNQPFDLKNLAALLQKQIEDKLPPLLINNYIFDWSRPYIMGILNVTPDSFSDGGLFFDEKSAIEHVVEMIKDGADIIDIGGESTRPNALNITVNEEINRVIPIIKLIRKQNINIPISVDTRNYETAKSAIEAGADIINDVSGLDYDKKLFNFVISENIPVIIMHSDSVPAKSADYTKSDIVEEVYLSLNNKIKLLVNSGYSADRIIADVGIGFGKSAESSFELLKRHNEFKSLKVPMLLGISRKSFIRNTFNITTDESDIPTAIYSAITKNVNIHRVHNVKLTKQYLDFARKSF